MRMAKTQKATLDPTKISGRCGRLMCCLRYEDENYEFLRKKLPRRNTWVRTAEVVGKVVDTQIITQLVRIALQDGTMVAVANEDIIERDMATPPPPVKGSPGNGRRSNARYAVKPKVAKPDAQSDEETPVEQEAEKAPTKPNEKGRPRSRGKGRPPRRRRGKSPQTDRAQASKADPGESKSDKPAENSTGQDGNAKKKSRRRRRRRPGGNKK